MTSIDQAIQKQAERVDAGRTSCTISASIVWSRLEEINIVERLDSHRRLCDQIEAELTNLRKLVGSLRRELTLLERVRDKKENGYTAL